MAVTSGNPFRAYTLIDGITQIYAITVALLVVFLHGNAVPKWPLFVVAHALLVVVVHNIVRINARFPGRGALDFVRNFYPLLLYIFFYCETGLLNHMLTDGYLDPFFIRLEGRIFGFQPSLRFMDKFPYLPVSELFYAAYFSYYMMVFGVGLALFISERAKFFHYISVLSFAFYVCCLIYIFVPVVGPRIFYPELSDYRLPANLVPNPLPPFPEAIKAGPFYQLMDWIYKHLETPGGSFPSSHVAIGLGTVYFSFLYLPRIRYAHLIAAILLCMATVYCRYHYVVDVIAGVITFLALVPLGNRLFFKFADAELAATLRNVTQSKLSLRAAQPPVR